MFMHSNLVTVEQWNLLTQSWKHVILHSNIMMRWWKLDHKVSFMSKFNQQFLKRNISNDQRKQSCKDFWKFTWIWFAMFCLKCNFRSCSNMMRNKTLNSTQLTSETFTTVEARWTTLFQKSIKQLLKTRYCKLIFAALMSYIFFCISTLHLTFIKKWKWWWITSLKQLNYNIERMI